MSQTFAPNTAAMRRRPWVVLICAATLVTIAMGIRQSFGLFLRPIELDTGIGREAFGLAIAVQNLILGLAQPFVGALADRHGAWPRPAGRSMRSDLCSPR